MSSYLGELDIHKTNKKHHERVVAILVCRLQQVSELPLSPHYEPVTHKDITFT